MRVVSQGFYVLLPQPNLVRECGKLGFLLYTSAKTGSLGWSVMVPIRYPSIVWFVGVVLCEVGDPGFDLLLV